MAGGYSSVSESAMSSNWLMQSIDDHRGGRMAETEQDDLEARIRRSIDAYHEAAMVYAAVKLGLPDLLRSNAATPGELAVKLGLSAPHLHRFLRGLASLGICEEGPDGSFALTSGGQSLSTGSPSQLAKKVQIVVGQYWWPWSNFQSNLKSGKPAFEQCFGMSILDWRAKHAEQGVLFHSYLAGETLAHGDSIVEALDVSGVQTVADIGDGYGSLLAALLRAHPHLRGLLFDRADIIAGAESYLKSLGIADRVIFIGGDILSSIPVRADLYVLKGVLQQSDDSSALTILKNCREAMSECTRLFIIERLMAERAADDPAAIMLDLHMMTITGGRARSLAEFETLLSQADLKLSKATSTRAGLTVIEAVRARSR
jgi:hypothetical protein